MAEAVLKLQSYPAVFYLGSQAGIKVLVPPDYYITDGPGATRVITSTVLPQREIQFGLKLHF